MKFKILPFRRKIRGMLCPFFAFIGLLCLSYNLQAQCTTDLLAGQNLVVNGDFSGDYAGWTHAANYTEAVAPSPGHIYVGTNPQLFNAAFLKYGDHTSTPDGKF